MCVVYQLRCGEEGGRDEHGGRGWRSRRGGRDEQMGMGGAGRGERSDGRRVEERVVLFRRGGGGG